MEVTWMIDRGHGEKEISSRRLDCPGSFLIMSFSIVDKRCSEIRVQGGRPCAATVGFTHVEGMTESVFRKEEQKVTAEGLSLALFSIFSLKITLFSMQITIFL